jgi:hypothetical protein
MQVLIRVSIESENDTDPGDFNYSCTEIMRSKHSSVLKTEKAKLEATTDDDYEILPLEEWELPDTMDNSDYGHPDYYE